MSPNFLVVALFAAFLVGGVLARRSPPRHPPAGSGTSRASHRLAAGARGGWVHQQAFLTGAS
jgi:hypothetical protein